MLRDINGLAGNGALDKVMIFAAKDLIYLVCAALVVVAVPALRRRDWGRLAAVAACLVLAYVFNLLAAASYAEQRPFTTHPGLHELVRHAPGQSFPSDHATAAFAIAIAVTVFLSRAAGAVLLAAAALIGFARIYVGIHYPGDIGGGLLVAAAGVALVALAWRATAGFTSVPLSRAAVHR